jgi:hypothetical protein
MAVKIRAKRKPRVKRPVEEKVGGYDSGFEYELHNTILQDWSLKPEPVPYVIAHKYYPDFTKVIDGKTILLESKGRFWDYPEFSKYIWIKKSLPENYELVFLFGDPSAPMPQAKRRKDGTKRSHGEWASANNFRWFSKWSMPDEWIKK